MAGKQDLRANVSSAGGQERASTHSPKRARADFRSTGGGACGGSDGLGGLEAFQTVECEVEPKLELGLIVTPPER